MFTDIHLLNVPELDVHHNHTFSFANKEQQLNYFLSKKVKTIENVNYHRKNNNLKVNFHIDELQFVNYVMINNEVPLNKWYFYFVIDRRYINENCTELILKIDVMQTYLFDYTFKSSLVERQHYNRYTSDGTVVNAYFKQPIDYNTGEYIVNYSSTIYSYYADGSYIITSSEPLGKGANYRNSGSSNGSGDSGGSGIIGEYPYNSSISETINNRFSKIWQGVKEGQSQGLFPSVTYAQYVMECGWEGSTLSETYNNAFGIKASNDWTGQTVDLPTQEYINGEWITTTATWRVYDDINQSVRDRTQFLLENSRYTEGGVFSASTYQEQCQALQNSGYATDPSYATLLISIIEDNNFTIYDTVSDSDDSGDSGDSGVSIRYNIVNSALKLIGKPYRYGGNYPPLDSLFGGSSDGTDCSGLCQWAYNDSGAINFTSITGRWTTYSMYPKSTIISLSEAQAGDVIYTLFNTNGLPEHVYMIKSVDLSNNTINIIEAQQLGTNILERSVTYDDTMVIGRLI